jgi:hypothetical protein
MKPTDLVWVLIISNVIIFFIIWVKRQKDNDENDPYSF